MLSVHFCAGSEIPRLVIPQPKQRVDPHPYDLVWIRFSNLFDLYSTFSRSNHYRTAPGAIISNSEIDLCFNIDGLIDKYFPNREILYLHSQDLCSCILCLFRRFHHSDAARFPSSSDEHLGFNDDSPTELLGD